MPIRVKKILKILIIIISLPIIIPIVSYLLEFIMQLGRIVGTIIRIIMNLWKRRDFFQNLSFFVIKSKKIIVITFLRCYNYL